MHLAARRDGRGMVTAELAVAVLAAFALLMMFCGGIGVLVTQMRCIDTAREVARQAARGDAAAVRTSERDAPTGAEVSIRRDGPRVRVTVRLRVVPLGGLLPAVPLRADAVVTAEPGVDP